MISRGEIFQRIQRLPEEEREEATALALEIFSRTSVGGPSEAGRRIAEERAKYAGDPARYFRDIFGYRLTAQQEDVLQVIQENTRVLIPSANNVGKTWILSAYGVFWFDAEGAVPDVEAGLDEGGARVLLPGPDHATVFSTMFQKALVHAEMAERRGHPMPGFRSDASVLWRVRAEWEWEAFCPPKKRDRNVAHTAAGRHHRRQIALIEEGQGVDAALWTSTEGMCSGAGNKIISPFNPTEAAGPAYQRAQAGGWRVVHLSALDHPNVRGRQIVVPGAVDFLVIDAKVRTCDHVGTFPEVVPDEEKREFVYAVPVLGAAERGPRRDGHLGHPDADLSVYRPNAIFESTVLGQWPKAYDARLFSPADWDAAVDRHRARTVPPGEPDRLGLDAARTGADDTVGAPVWGETAEVLLRRYREAQLEGEAAVEEFRAAQRVYIGRLVTFPKGDGVDVAHAVTDRFPLSFLVIDQSGVGASVYDHAARVIGVKCCGISFGGEAPEVVPGEPFSDDMRASLYVRASMMVRLGLVDVPDDPMLREEVLAHETVLRYRSVEFFDESRGEERKDRVPCVGIVSKDDIKKKIGRSPDKADAFVLALCEVPRKRRKVVIR